MRNTIIDWIISLVAFVIIVFGVAAFAKRVKAERASTFIATVRHDKNYDPSLSYFRLAFPDGTYVIIIGDDDLPITKWLAEVANTKIKLEQTSMPERIER